MSTNAMIAVLVGLMVNAVVFGIGAVAVLAVPSLATHAAILLPVVIVASFLITPFISFAIAPTLRARRMRGQVDRLQ